MAGFQRSPACNRIGGPVRSRGSWLTPAPLCCVMLLMSGSDVWLYPLKYSPWLRPCFCSAFIAALTFLLAIPAPSGAATFAGNVLFVVATRLFKLEGIKKSCSGAVPLSFPFNGSNSPNQATTAAPGTAQPFSGARAMAT